MQKTPQVEETFFTSHVEKTKDDTEIKQHKQNGNIKFLLMLFLLRLLFFSIADVVVPLIWL
jgi:hypothetical protein